MHYLFVIQKALCSGNDIILTPNILSKDELCLQNMIYWNRSTQSPGHNLNSLTFSNEILDIAARIYSESDLKLYLYHMSIGKTYFEVFFLILIKNDQKLILKISQINYLIYYIQV